MAESRGRGDARTTRGRSGQQAGSSRPDTTGGSARPAPKKGDMPAEGTRQAGAPKRGQPAKGEGTERKR
jgi:hypothetical protein